MSRAIICAVVALIVLGFSLAGGQSAQAQVPMAVTAYYPPTPVVTYLPERRGLFGQRLVYRPAVAYTAPVAVMVPVAPACATSVVAPTTTYYAPATVTAPVTTYYAPAPVTAPTTTYFSPAAPAPVAVPTTTFYAPAAPVFVAPVAVAPVTVYCPVVIPAVVWP
jgi:hypothetical protein